MLHTYFFLFAMPFAEWQWAVQWLALLPHKKKVLGKISRWREQLINGQKKGGK